VIGAKAFASKCSPKMAMRGARGVCGPISVTTPGIDVSRDWYKLAHQKG